MQSNPLAGKGDQSSQVQDVEAACCLGIPLSLGSDNNIPGVNVLELHSSPSFHILLGWPKSPLCFFCTMALVVLHCLELHSKQF